MIPYCCSERPFAFRASFWHHKASPVVPAPGWFFQQYVQSYKASRSVAPPICIYKIIAQFHKSTNTAQPDHTSIQPLSYPFLLLPLLLLIPHSPIPLPTLAIPPPLSKIILTTHTPQKTPHKPNPTRINPHHPHPPSPDSRPLQPSMYIISIRTPISSSSFSFGTTIPKNQHQLDPRRLPP